MTDKNKTKEQEIFERMGRELAALRDLIGHIITDPEYNAVMTRKTCDKLCAAQSRVDAVRSEAETRMTKYIPGWHTETFYPTDRRALGAAIEEFRERMKETIG